MKKIDESGFTPHPWKIFPPTSFSFYRNWLFPSSSLWEKGQGNEKGGYRKRNLPKVTGFTVIELLVVISVAALLSAMPLIYSRVSERQVILFREQARVMSIILRAKSLAVATFGKTEVPCGYGVHFEASRSFILFKDLANNCNASDNEYSGTVELIDSFSLDPSVAFDIPSQIDIVFIPPEPTIILTPQREQIEVAMKTTDGKGTVKIIVTDVGQISTE